MDQLQLQKLVYYAHGWHYAFLDLPLTSDNVYAWDYGPVYKELWKKIRSHRNWKISKLTPETDQTLSLDQEELLVEVFSAYGGFSGNKLSAMTHQEDSPWYNVYVIERRPRKVIPGDAIAEYFKTLHAESTS